MGQLAYFLVQGTVCQRFFIGSNGDAFTSPGA
ncbi:hypothetical protein DES41_12043 [Pseudorhodoferax soli]|uniref:Uncharacterized protein n=1 Tax=Pseudorhodoferax soli TaxID=545864 RepID=A0A368X683_9BURK|nr:hypothetical protein DES41_12043 [Pseudorhodoferax soli]